MSDPESADPDRQEGEAEAEGPPAYDPVAVGRVAARVQIEGVQLLEAHFSRAASDEPFPEAPPPDAVPAIGINVGWALSDDRSRLACAVSFGTEFPNDPGNDPWGIFALFRLEYTVEEGPDLADGDAEQFAHWNAVFNAWPYWREYVASTLSRAELPHFVVPVIGVPRPPDSIGTHSEDSELLTSPD